MSDLNKGGCLCGAVRYETSGPPVRVTICHCTFCQRFTGAPFQALSVFKKDSFAPSGETRTYDHLSDGSGCVITLHSCPACATNLWAELERFPGTVGVVSGTFDNPNWVPRTSALARHVFTRSACAGTVLPADVDLYREQAILNDGSAATPFRLDHPLTIGPNGGLPEELL